MLICLTVFYQLDLLDMETFGKRLMSIHNVRFLIRLVEEARVAIQEDRYEEFMKEKLAEFGDERGF